MPWSIIAIEHLIIALRDYGISYKTDFTQDDSSTKVSSMCIDSLLEKERLTFYFNLALYYPISFLHTIPKVILFSIVHIAMCVGKH